MIYNDIINMVDFFLVFENEEYSVYQDVDGFIIDFPHFGSIYPVDTILEKIKYIAENTGYTPITSILSMRYTKDECIRKYYKEELIELQYRIKSLKIRFVERVVDIEENDVEKTLNDILEFRDIEYDIAEFDGGYSIYFPVVREIPNLEFLINTISAFMESYDHKLSNIRAMYNDTLKDIVTSDVDFCISEYKLFRNIVLFYSR